MAGLDILVLIGIGVFIILVVAFRFIGAWLFRIDEVIKLLRQILLEIKKQNNE